MKKILISLFLLLSFNALSANDSCESFTYSKNSCEFNFPTVSNNEIQTSEFSDERFSGVAIARCVNGKYAIKKSVCEKKKKNTCDYVSSTTWNNGNISCTHGSKELNLKEGERQKVFSNENQGHITYECFNGRLQGIEQSCEKREAVFAPKAATENVCYYDSNNRIENEYYDEEDEYNNFQSNSESYVFKFNGNIIASDSCDDSECTGFTSPTQITYNGKIYTRGNKEHSDSSISGAGSTYVERSEDFYEICVEEEVQTQCTNYNTASVSNLSNGYKVTRCFVEEQTNSTVESLCSNTTSPTVYDSHNSANANGGITYNVTCVENTEICSTCEMNIVTFSSNDRLWIVLSRFNVCWYMPYSLIKKRSFKLRFFY